MATKKAKARSSLWMRLKQKPTNASLIGPDVGQSIIPIPDAWPKPEIPVWKELEYRNKLPLPHWHRWQLTTGLMNQGYTPQWAGSVFDTWDNNNHVYDTEYHPLHDPHLLDFTAGRRKILVRNGLITPEGDVKATLREYNHWRRHLFRFQHQLIIKKQAMAHRDELCNMIRGFLTSLKKNSTARAEHRKTIYDVSDIQADPRYNEGDEYSALLVELSKFHDLLKQVRLEILSYIRQRNHNKMAERERNRREKLLTSIQTKDELVTQRRHFAKVEEAAQNRKKKAEEAFERRLKYQQETGEEDEKAQETTRSRSEKNVERRKRMFQRLHEKNRPKLPSASGQGDQASAQDDKKVQFVDEPEDEEELTAKDTQSFASHFVDDVEENTSRNLDQDEEAVEDVFSVGAEELNQPRSGAPTFRRWAPGHDSEDRSSKLKQVYASEREEPDDTTEYDDMGSQHDLVGYGSKSEHNSKEFSENHGDSKSGSLKSALSKSNANHSSSKHHHVSFAPSAAADPAVPTAVTSAEKLHDDAPPPKQLLSRTTIENPPEDPKTRAGSHLDSMCIMPSASQAGPPGHPLVRGASREVVTGTRTTDKPGAHLIHSAIFVPAKSRSQLDNQQLHPSPSRAKVRDRLDEFLKAQSEEHASRISPEVPVLIVPPKRDNMSKTSAGEEVTSESSLDSAARILEDLLSADDGPQEN